MVGSASWAQSHPNTIIAFLRAYNQGQQIAHTDRGEVGSMQNFPFTGYIGATGWAQGHSGTVAAFLRVLAEGQELADTDREAVESAMEKYAGITPLVAHNILIDSYPLSMDLP